MAYKARHAPWLRDICRGLQIPDFFVIFMIKHQKEMRYVFIYVNNHVNNGNGGKYSLGAA